MLNIASVNMPKIKPETWVLIIKTLKSPAEVADIFNVSKRQVERIRKRYQETGDVHERQLPRSGRPCKTTTGDDSLLVRLSKSRPMSTALQLQEEWTPAMPVLSRTVRPILACNGLHGRIAAQKPALNKRQLRYRVAYAKAHSLTEDWTAEKWRNIDFSDESSVELHPKRCQNIVDDPQGPVWTHGSPRQSNLEVERLWFGVTSNMEVPGRSVRWMVTLIVPNINRFLPLSTFPSTRAVRFFNRMELLAIPQVPLWRFSGGRRSRSWPWSRSGMASTVSRYEYYWAYLGKNEGGSLDGSKFTTLCQTLWENCQSVERQCFSSQDCKELRSFTIHS